jgi:hypothetical protein
MRKFHEDVNKSLVESVMNTEAWERCGLTVKPKEEDNSLNEAGASQSGRILNKFDGNPDYYKDKVWDKGKKLWIKKTTPTQTPAPKPASPVKEAELEEEVEPMCPLCEATLSEPLSEDRLSEHVEDILEQYHQFLVENEDEDEDGEELTEEEGGALPDSGAGPAGGVESHGYKDPAKHKLPKGTGGTDPLKQSMK